MRVDSCGPTSTLKTRTYSFSRARWWWASLVISTSEGAWTKAKTATTRKRAARFMGRDFSSIREEQLSPKAGDQVEDQRECHADEDGRGQGKIDGGVFPAVDNVAGKLA